MESKTSYSAAENNEYMWVSQPVWCLLKVQQQSSIGIYGLYKYCGSLIIVGLAWLLVTEYKHKYQLSLSLSEAHLVAE